MPSVANLSESYSFTPSTKLELFTLDCSTAGIDAVYYFVNGSNCNYQSITFNGVNYMPFPILIEQMDKDGKGTLPRPRLSVSNINGYVSTLLLSNDTTLEGATVTRTCVHARFIDASNFPAGQPLPQWVTPDPLAAYPSEPFVVNRLMTQNQQIVQWELVTPLEMQNVKLPRRQVIANTCVAWKYRQAGTCNYSGVPVADRTNKTFFGGYGLTLTDKGAYDSSVTYNQGDYVYTLSSLPQFSSIKFYWVCNVTGTTGILPKDNSTNWIADQCAKNVAACKLRFPNVPLRTAAFPGVSRANWVSRG